MTILYYNGDTVAMYFTVMGILAVVFVVGYVLISWYRRKKDFTKGMEKYKDLAEKFKHGRSG